MCSTGHVVAVRKIQKSMYYVSLKPVEKIRFASVEATLAEHLLLR